MPLNEFQIIARYFAKQDIHRRDAVLGIGDDGAIVDIPPGHQLIVTTDTLVAGVHFAADTASEDIGYKSLAVNLSDLAAMGAQAAWVTLALTLPSANTEWLENFCRGFFSLAQRYQVELIGGDLTHGPLSITVQAMGLTPTGKTMRRSGTRPGDLIYVTGTLGDAGLALRMTHDVTPLHRSYLLQRLHRPEPRLDAGLALRDLASAAIDISDGLAADLSHILEQSHVGAKIEMTHLPLSTAAQTVSEKIAWSSALTAGDDYELCVTIPREKKSAAETAMKNSDCAFTCIGEITADLGLDLQLADGRTYQGALDGYQHF